MDTVLSYCHNSLNNTLLSGLVPYLKRKGVGIISASPLSMGLLAPQASLLADKNTVSDLLVTCHKRSKGVSNNTLLSGLVPYLQRKGVGITSTSPLSVGMLAAQASLLLNCAKNQHMLL